MGVIYMNHQLTGSWQEFVHIHHINIHCHTGNVCCVVVCHTKNQMDIIPTHLLRYKFYIYHFFAHFKVHGKIPIEKKKLCRFCLQNLATMSTGKIYTRKELVTMETSTVCFNTNVYSILKKTTVSPTTRMYPRD